MSECQDNCWNAYMIDFNSAIEAFELSPKLRQDYLTLKQRIDAAGDQLLNCLALCIN
jgi:hypothetical protein